MEKALVVTISEMTMEHYEAAMALWKNMPGIGLSKADSRESMAGFLERNPGLSFVAKHEGNIVGTVLCGHDGRRGYLYHLAVAEAYRRKGLGRKLVETCLRKLAEERIERCHVFVLADNDTGLRFWTQTGWVRRDELHVVSRDLSGSGASEKPCVVFSRP